MSRISERTIEQVKSQDLLDYLQTEKLELKKRGRDWVGLCPFHTEKTGSFTVSPSKNLYYCFGCGASGGLIKFVQEFNKLSFREAVLSLADHYNVSIELEDEADTKAWEEEKLERETLSDILSIAMYYYQDQLESHERAMQYLQSRKLTLDTIHTWQLGYAPKGTTLFPHLIEVGYTQEQVLATGLGIQCEDGRLIDRFRHRIMIPFFDSLGRIVGFGGRASKGDSPKYLNSPETVLFQKSKLLFGLHKAKSDISKQNQAIVVEGYFDVIALHQAGITTAVASSGTALNSEQLRTLTKLTNSNQVVLNFDADEAGIKAATRVIENNQDLLLNNKVDLRILTLTDAKDADEFLSTQGTEAYQSLIKDAPLWIDWQLDQVVNSDLNPIQMQSEIAEILKQIPDGLLRIDTTQKAAEKLAKGQVTLIPRLVKSLESATRVPRSTPRPQQVVSQNPATRPTSLREKAENRLLKLFIHKEEVRELILDSLNARDQRFEIYDRPWAIVTSVTNWNERWTDKLSPEDLTVMSPFLFLDPLDEAQFNRPTVVVRQTIATLEWVDCQTRCHRLLESILNTLDERDQDEYRAQLLNEQEWLKHLQLLRKSDSSEL